MKEPGYIHGEAYRRDDGLFGWYQAVRLLDDFVQRHAASCGAEGLTAGVQIDVPSTAPAVMARCRTCGLCGYVPLQMPVRLMARSEPEAAPLPAARLPRPLGAK